MSKQKKLRVLFVSGELIAGDLAYRLKNEGCEVKLYIKDKSRKDCLDGMVDKTDNWKKELNWVGKDGLIVFDDVGYGKIQDDLREKGYQVVGGSEGGDKLELHRSYATKIFAACDIKTTELFDFHNLDSAIKYIKDYPAKWVIKQNGHSSSFTYVGEMDDGSDAISVLENYKKYVKNKDINVISLQKKIEGVEIAAGRYFNGKNWVGPVGINIEHKNLFNGGIGPLTGEMGTIIWYENDSSKVFIETLKKIEPYLRKCNFKGYIDINCIVNSANIYPLEATARFGCPTNQLQSKMHLSKWSTLLMAVARGDKYNLNCKSGYGIVISICIPPFPYKSISSEYYLKNVEVLFKDKLKKEEINRIHFEEVSVRKMNNKNRYYISGGNGFTLYITGSGDTVKKAREDAYALIKKLVIPKMFYRTDIGLKFINEDEKKLKKWGWI